MSVIELLAINNLKLYADWSKAPNGTLLQLRDRKEETLFVGMKCTFPVTNGEPVPGIFYLEGDKAGEWTAWPKGSPAIDVSSELELSAVEPALMPLLKTQQVGHLHIDVQEQAFFIWGYSGDLGGWLCVRGSENFEKGNIYYTADLSRIYSLGKLALAHWNPFGPKLEFAL